MATERRADPPDATKQTIYSPAEVARKLHVDERTVRRWVTARVIPADHTAAGHHLISESTLQALQQLANEKVPLNTRELRRRFDQSQLEEGRSQTTS